MGRQYKISAEKTGHYSVFGDMSEKTRCIWIVLHGYGQLARYFIKKFEVLDPSIHYVIAPEGLNRYYIDEPGHTRVASTWMTKEDRLDEIADYILFLERLRHKMNWDANPFVKVIYLGFSQGVATLSRWLVNVYPRADRIIFWAGMPAEDIWYEQHKSYFEKTGIEVFAGNTDPYFTEEREQKGKIMLERAGAKYKTFQYEGGHTIPPDAILRLAADISSGRDV